MAFPIRVQGAGSRDPAPWGRRLRCRCIPAEQSCLFTEAKTDT